MNEWMKEWANEWVTEWTNEWVNEWRWVGEKIKCICLTSTFLYLSVEHRCATLKCFHKLSLGTYNIDIECFSDGKAKTDRKWAPF